MYDSCFQVMSFFLFGGGFQWVCAKRASRHHPSLRFEKPVRLFRLHECGAGTGAEATSLSVGATFDWVQAPVGWGPKDRLVPFLVRGAAGGPAGCRFFWDCNRPPMGRWGGCGRAWDVTHVRCVGPTSPSRPWMRCFAKSERNVLGCDRRNSIYRNKYILSIGMGSQYSRYTGTCHILLAQVPNQVKRSFSARASC